MGWVNKCKSKFFFVRMIIKEIIVFPEDIDLLEERGKNSFQKF